MKKRKAEKTRKQKKHAAGWDGVLSWEGKTMSARARMGVRAYVRMCVCPCVHTLTQVCWG